MSCEQCEKPVGKQGKRFCSTTCWYAFTKARRTITCEVCKSPFERTVKTQRACSVECGNKLKRQDRNVVCKTCGTLFERPHGKTRIFCSRSCAQMNRVRLGESKKPDGYKNTAPNGYVMTKHDGGWIQEHRLVMEQKLGRRLLPSERIHHKNGDRGDNRVENLELWGVTGKSKKDPPGQRLEDLMNSMLQSLPESQRAETEAAFRKTFRI